MFRLYDYITQYLYPSPTSTTLPEATPITDTIDPELPNVIVIDSMTKAETPLSSNETPLSSNGTPLLPNGTPLSSNGTPDIKEFNMEWIGDDKIIIIISKRNGGKTVLALDYLYHNQNFPVGVVISPNEDFNYDYKPHVPSVFIHDKYSIELSEGVLERQKYICRNCRINPRYKDSDPHAFIILDNCLADAYNLALDENIKWIFMNKRLIKLTLILTMDNPMSITPNLRTEIDWVFICKHTKIGDQKRLYEMYGSLFPTFEMFREVLNYCTKDYGCLVIDNSSTSDNLFDRIYCYRADIKGKAFKVCKPILWKMSV